MKRLKTIMLLALLGLMSACTNELDERIDYVGENTPTSPQSPYHISLSQALDNLKATSSALGLETTRSLERGNWTVQRIPLSHFNSKTRTNETTEDSDAVYVVNFDNAEGYAILSADNRLPDDVIAVTNSGTYNFTPGPVTDFENPLTLEDLYVEEDDDYLLGSVEQNDIIDNLLINYVNGWTDSLRGDFETGETPIIPPTEPINYSFTYQTTREIPEMLTYNWGQHSPFNDRCPKRYKYSGLFGILMSSIEEYDFDGEAEWGDDFLGVEELYAGCVAIAVSQILAYHNFPDTDDIEPGEDCITDWRTLRTNNLGTESHVILKTDISRLVHTIGVGCDMIYGFWGSQFSFATPVGARDYLRELGYTNVERTLGYDLSIIVESLENDCPIFIGAVSGDVDGHAWVIDGYKEVDCIKTGTNSDGIIVVSPYVVSTTKYVHCNWGWHGSHNGWFASNLHEQSFITDEDTEYDHLYRLVTYDKPNTGTE